MQNGRTWYKFSCGVVELTQTRWEVGCMAPQGNPQSPLISVVVPVYKAEDSVGRCIDSILGQTYNNLQLVLVDDGSPDNSGAICDQYAAKDSRVTVLHTENGGVSAARNNGLNAATGEYVAFVDSDDHIGPDFLLDAYTQLTQHGADLFICGLRMETYDGDKLLSAEELKGPDRTYTVCELFNAFNEDYPFLLICGPWCKLFRMDIIQAHTIRFDTAMNLGEDMVFNFDYHQHIDTVRFSSNMHYHYHRGDGESLFSRYNPKLYELNVKIYDRMRQLMHARGAEPAAIQRFETLYARIQIACIYHEYQNSDKSTPQSRKEVIRKVTDEKRVRQVPLSDYRHPKDLVVVSLVKMRARRALQFLFERHYRKA